MDGNKFNQNLAEACREGLLYYLAGPAKSDYARTAWSNKKLSPDYYYWKTGKLKPLKRTWSLEAVRRREARHAASMAKQPPHDRTGYANLSLHGTLRQELLTEAPSRVRMDIKPYPKAETYLDAGNVPYAAAHQYGYKSLPERRYIRLQENQQKIARQMRRWLQKRFTSKSG